MENVGLNLSEVGLAAALLAASLSGPAFADACGSVRDAVVAQTKVPYAATTVMGLTGAPPTTTETISADGKLYFQINGAWHSGPHDAQAEIDKMNAAAKTATCTQESDDTVNGQSVAVFMVHHKTEHSESDNRIWISKATGLPLKTDAHFKDGLTVAIAFKYDNIHPPADVK
jgi:hypothetical protein